MGFYVRGQVIPLEGGGSPVRFQFNPHRYDGPTAVAGWDQVKVAGRDQPWLQFSCGETTVLKVDIKLSSDGGASVKDQVDALTAFKRPTVRGAGVNHPPRLKLILGSFVRLNCVLKEVSPSFGHPADPATLMPYHGDLTLTFWEYTNE